MTERYFLLPLKKVSSDISCTFFKDGEIAIEELQAMTTLPEIIFLDLNMPRMEGIEFLQLIVNIEKLKNIPIIIYSTSSYIEASKSKISAATTYITKPESIEDLVEMLRKILNTKVLKNDITE